MSKPLLGLLLGAVLGLLDGLSAWFSPDARPMMLAIVVGSTVKGLITGLLTGLIVRWIYRDQCACRTGHRVRAQLARRAGPGISFCHPSPKASDVSGIRAPSRS
jgi:hypothetical protein